MIWIKFFNLIFIIFICSYIGIIKSQKFEIRVKELNKFQNAILMLKNKMEFTYEPISNIFEEISHVIYRDEKNIFKDTINNPKQINDSWIDSTKELSKVFSEEDVDIIRNFGKLLGKTDIEGQVSEVLFTQKLIEKQLKDAENECRKNTKLYKSMGIISGVGICIIFI